MGIVTSQYDWVFNDVQFALDMKSARNRDDISARALALACGWESAAVIYAIERCAYTESLSLKHVLAICNMLNLHFPEYFEIEPATRIDLMRKLGQVAQS